MNEFYNLPRKAVSTKRIDAHALQSWGAKERGLITYAGTMLKFIRIMI